MIKKTVIILFILLLNEILIYCFDKDNHRVDVAYSLDDKKYYILINGFYKEITEIAAATIVNPNPIIIQNKEFLDLNYKNGGKYNFDLDDKDLSDVELITIVIKYIEEVSNGNNLLLYDLRVLDHNKEERRQNVAFISIDNVYLAIDRNYFFWLNNNFEVDNDLNNQRQKFTRPLREEDHRLLLLRNGDILATFTALLPEVNHKVGIRFIKRKGIENGITVYNDISDAVALLAYDDDPTHTEKNWIPFNYGDDFYFIKHFSPFRIVQIDKSKSSDPIRYTYESTSFDIYRVSLISQHDCQAFQWIYGGIRGGTPAQLVRGEYLAFFHTKSKMEYIFPNFQTGARLYFNGAYTFTKLAPFRLSKMTKTPITNEYFRPYDNPRILGIDYVTYFMSFVLIDKEGTIIPEGQEENDPDSTTIVISIGLNDHETVIAKMNLNELLDSMVDLNC